MITQELWYAVKVSCRSECKIGAMLSSKGLETFLPTFKAKRRRAGLIKVQELPLFPGYLFCRFDVRKRLPVLTTPGVGFIVGAGKLPEPIDESEIEAIRSVIKSGSVYEPYPYVTIGQLVRVEYGALSGLTGLVTDARGEFRLIISVNLLMRSVSVDIDRAWVKPVNAGPERSSRTADVIAPMDPVQAYGA